MPAGEIPSAPTACSSRSRIEQAALVEICCERIERHEHPEAVPLELQPKRADPADHLGDDRIGSAEMQGNRTQIFGR